MTRDLDHILQPKERTTMRRPTTWNPFTEITDMQSEIMHNVMEQMANSFRRPDMHRHMDVDLSEDEKSYTLQAVLPGADPEKLSVDLVDGVLTIKAETYAREDAEHLRYHLRERYYGTYERSFRFPSLINVEAIEANYQNGILTLVLPKTQSVKSHRIRVQCPE
jgi:HSP20 family protein